MIEPEIENTHLVKKGRNRDKEEKFNQNNRNKDREEKYNLNFRNRDSKVSQARIAQLVAFRLGTGDVPGSNPGKGKNFSVKISYWIVRI